MRQWKEFHWLAPTSGIMQDVSQYMLKPSMTMYTYYGSTVALLVILQKQKLKNISQKL
jgi:hypothetical protein